LDTHTHTASFEHDLLLFYLILADLMMFLLFRREKKAKVIPVPRKLLRIREVAETQNVRERKMFGCVFEGDADTIYIKKC
jgi:hypothetical protein